METEKTLEEIVSELPVPEVILEKTPAESFNEELDQILEHERSRARPDVSGLADAVVFDDDGDPVFVPQPGERVVIERWITFATGRVWLDTETYRVVSVDHETGNLRLVNDSLRQHSMSNFITGTERGYVFKLPGTVNVGKRHRGRPKKRRGDYSEPAQKPTGAPKKRGRPKGSKNRPRDVVQAEKNERRQKMQEKRLKREARKIRRGR